MNILQFILVTACCIGASWAVTKWVPQATLKLVLLCAIWIGFVVWLLKALGFWATIAGAHV